MRSIEFDPAAFDDLAWSAEQDRGQAIRIIRRRGMRNAIRFPVLVSLNR